MACSSSVFEMTMTECDIGFLELVQNLESDMLGIDRSSRIRVGLLLLDSESAHWHRR